jgi:hypothetical protein
LLFAFDHANVIYTYALHRGRFRFFYKWARGGGGLILNIGNIYAALTHPCSEILMRLHEIFWTSKKQKTRPDPIYVLGNNVIFFSDFGESFYGFIQVVFFMAC